MRAAQLPLPTFNGQGGFLIELGLNNLDLRPIDTKREQLDSYVGWVTACVGTIAQDLRTNPWAVWRKSGKDREDWEPLEVAKLPQVFKMPNSIDKTWGQLVERRNLHKDTTGEAYWHLITTSPGGKVLGIEMIQPDYVKEPVFDNTDRLITGWKVEVPGRNADTLPALDVIPDFYPSPKDPFRGASPIEAFALAHHFDLYLRAYGVKLIRDGALVSQYVKTEQELTPDQAAALEERFTQKYRTPGRMGVFGKGASVEAPGLPLRDLDLLRALKPSRELILGMYKMPASKLGIVEDANRANMDAASKNYAENALLPRLKTFDEIVNSILLRLGLNPDQFAYESESPVEEDRDTIFKEAIEKLKSGAIKVNQFLNEIGDEDQGDEGEVYLMPATVTVVKSLVEAASQPEPEEPEEPQTDPLDDAAQRIALAAAPVLVMNEVARLERALAEERWLRAQENLERKAKGKLREQFSRDLKIVKKLFEENTQNRAALPVATRDWVDDAITAGREEWTVLIEAILSESIKTGWELFKGEVAGGLAFNMFEQRALEFARRLAGEKIVGIEQTTIEAVRGVISEAVEAGLTIPQTARKLAELYDDFKGLRSEVIARTETASSMGWGKYNAARESSARLGMTLQREWVSVLDGRTRPTHAAADGQQVGLHQFYSVGGFAMKHPGDPNAPASELINCRCTEVYRDVSD